ncbi:MAG TPA: SAM-dependent methyltransferase [Acidimicrobiales bacterium]|nr:SAM-dependent methyltransferase [Acidimicrobiales bacterium]
MPSEVPAGTALSAAPVWERQRHFFISEGPRVWQQGIVPSYISTNPYLASMLAEILVAYRAEMGQPIDVVELGAGSGRLGFHILRELTARLEPGDVRYVLTDLSPGMVEFWRQHPDLRPFVDGGVLDFALFDVAEPAPLALKVSGHVLGAQPSERPVAVIASYCFDSVPSDLFHVDEDGRLFECLVQVVQPDAAGDAHQGSWPDQDGFLFDLRPCGASYYGDAALDAVLEELQATALGMTVPMPATALQTLAFFADRWPCGVLAVIGDRGFTQPEYASELSVVEPTRHGSVSFPVNFGAIGTWVESRQGKAWHPSRPARSFNVSAFVFSCPGTATESAYRNAVDTRDADTFFTLKKAMEPHYYELSLREALALIRLSHWDPDIFSALSTRLVDAIEEPLDAATRAELRFTIDRVWAAHFAVGEDHLAFQLASVLYAVGDYRQALEFFGHAQGGTPGGSVDAWLNSAVCHQMLGERQEAIACVGHALTLAPGLEYAEELLQELGQPES